MLVDEQSLSDFLCDSGMLSRREIEHARMTAHQEEDSLSQVLVRTGMLHDDDLRRAEAHVQGVPFVVLERGSVPHEVLVLLPEPLSRAHNAVAFAESGRDVEVALLSMDELPAIQAHMGTRRVLPRLTNRTSITATLIQYQKHLKEMFGSALSRELAQLGAAHAAGDTAGAADAAVRVADALLRHALHQQAAEIHIEPTAGGVRVRYGTGAELYDAMTLPAASLPPLVARFKTLGNMPHTPSVPAAGRFKIAPYASAPVVVTVVSTPVMHEGAPAEKITLATTHEQGTGLSLVALGLSQKNLHILRQIAGKREGLVLVCGEAGSGTTTLLYTMLNELAGTPLHMASVEDMVRMTLPSVSQTQVNAEIGLGAASSVRAVLRHDPNVLMIDTALDEDTALLAARAANRGVFVLMRVDASSAAAGIGQMLALGVPPELLSATLSASIGTRMLPKLCVQSREPYRLSRPEQTALEETVNIKNVLAELKEDAVIETRTAWKDVPLYRAVACEECQDGYDGLVPLQEIILNTMTLKETLRTGASMDEDGLLFAEDALYKAVQGLVSAEHVLEVAAS